MKENGTIRVNVVAVNGSKLEKAVLQILKDLDDNHDRLKKAFSRKKEKQQKKIERRRL